MSKWSSSSSSPSSSSYSRFLPWKTHRKASPNCSPASSNSGFSHVFRPSIQEMKHVFEKFDVNKDDKISEEELGLLLRALGKENTLKEAASMMLVADTNGDGFIDFKEFTAVLVRGGGVQEADIRNAFAMFDIDGNGKISCEELYKVLKQIGEKCSFEECRRMVKAVDCNGDGLIDMQEFMILMTKTMNAVS